MANAPKIEDCKVYFPLQGREVRAGEFTISDAKDRKMISVWNASGFAEAVVNALNEHLALKAENTTLRSKLRVLKSQLKNASGVIDQAIQEIDETLAP